MPPLTSSIEFQEWLSSPEGIHLEFKKAEYRYDFEELVKYCCALANEGGGKMILGVTDKRPRKVIGTEAFIEPERTVHGLTVQRLLTEVREEGRASLKGQRRWARWSYSESLNPS